MTDFRITSVTVCANRLHHLKQTLPLLVEQDGLEMLVVDYGCQQGTTEWIRANYPSVKVVQLTNVGKFNLAKGRNAGAALATTPWLLFIDADTLVQSDLKVWSAGALQQGSFYLTSRYGSDQTGTFFCEREAFTRIGGYDECFDLWGGEDDDLYYRLARQGNQRHTYADNLFANIQHDDAERLAAYDQSMNRSLSLRISHLYRCMKYDAATLLGRELSMPERIHLRQLAAQSWRRTDVEGKFPNVFVSLGERDGIGLFNDFKLNRRMVYEIEKR